MTYDSLFHMAFYCATLLLTLTSIALTKFQKRTDLPQNKIFLLMNYFVFLNAVTCFCEEIFESNMYSHYAFYRLFLLCRFLYFVIHTALAPALFYYVMTVTGTFTEGTKLIKYTSLIPFFVTEFFAITNPIYHFVYYYGDDMSFTRNWAEILIYIVAIAYMIIAFSNLMLSWNSLRRRNRYALIYFFVITLIGVITQYFYIGIKSELFCEALALMGIMLTVENEDDRIDADTGVYNRNALKMDVNRVLIQKNILDVLCLKISNMDSISRITGLSKIEEIIAVVAEYLKVVVPRYCIYHTDTNTLVIILKQDKGKKVTKDIFRVGEKILDRFQSDWTVHGVPIKLTPVIMIAAVPTDIHTLDELLYMIESPVPKDAENSILARNELSFMARRAAVESAVSKGLAEGNFEVYYQPTYCMDGLRLHGAEALIRLHDKVIGDIFPDEFIPIAEQAGYIDDIDEFVLGQVCAFIKSGEPVRLGMDCINVNLSVLQCMSDDFIERILGIVNSYEIPKSFINFEITESVSASDYELLSDVIKKLKENGFQFSMDDYGTGYSNMHTLFTLDFDIVKIDKSILWDAEMSERGEIILENCVHMIKQMKRKILVEGVETKEHVEKLRTLGVDYLQGYFFSKPITKRELLVYCETK